MFLVPRIVYGNIHFFIAPFSCFYNYYYCKGHHNYRQRFSNKTALDGTTFSWDEYLLNFRKFKASTTYSFNNATLERDGWSCLLSKYGKCRGTCGNIVTIFSTIPWPNANKKNSVNCRKKQEPKLQLVQQDYSPKIIIGYANPNDSSTKPATNYNFGSIQFTSLGQHGPMNNFIRNVNSKQLDGLWSGG